MWKIFFYTFHNWERAELMLQSMEEKGWVIDKRIFLFFFHFTKKRAKKTKYLFTYNSLGEVYMFDIEHMIKSQFLGNLVLHGSIISPKIYRICKHEMDYSYLLTERNEKIREIIRNRIILGAFLSIVLSAFCVLSKILDQYSVSYSVLSALAFAYMLYRILGYIYITRFKDKK